jgi:hypothetical protein
MALIIPNVGEQLLLQFMVGDAAPAATWSLRLFVNDFTPSPTSVIGSFTEMSTQNYSLKSLTNTNWVISGPLPEALATYAEQTFTFDGSGGATNVYGYYLTDDTGGALLWAERFPSAPIVVPATFGGEIKLTPTFQFATLNEL